MESVSVEMTTKKGGRNITKKSERRKFGSVLRRGYNKVESLCGYFRGGVYDWQTILTPQFGLLKLPASSIYI